MSNDSIWPRDMSLSGATTPASVDLERWQWRSTPYFPKLKHYCSITIREFCDVSRTLVCVFGRLPLCRDAVGIFYSSSRLCSIGSSTEEKSEKISSSLSIKGLKERTISWSGTGTFHFRWTSCRIEQDTIKEYTAYNVLFVLIRMASRVAPTSWPWLTIVYIYIYIYIFL